MDTQTGLSRALLLLLLLHLSLLEGCPTLDLSQDGNRSEKEPLRCIPEPQRAVEPQQQGRGSEEVWKAKQAASAGGLGPRDSPLLWKPRSPKEMSTLGCFRQKIDRINSGGFGCKAAKTAAQITSAATVPFTEEETESQRDGVFQPSKYPDQ